VAGILGAKLPQPHCNKGDLPRVRLRSAIVLAIDVAETETQASVVSPL